MALRVWSAGAAIEGGPAIVTDVGELEVAPLLSVMV